MISKSADSNYTDEIIGIILIVVGLLLGMSLLTYHIDDPSFSSISSNQTVQNAIGKVGALLSDLFFQLFGIGSYLFPIFLIGLGGQFFRKGERRISKRISAGAALLLLTVSSLAEFEGRNGSGGAVSPNLKGGVSGRLLCRFFLDYFGSIGSYILLFFFLLLGSMLVFPFSPRAMLKKGMEVARALQLWLNKQILIREKQKKRRAGGILERTGAKEKNPTIARTPAMEPPPPRVALPPQQEVFTFARDEKGDYRLPPLSLLLDPSGQTKKTTQEEWIAQSQILERKLLDFDIEGRVTQVHPGPVVTMFEFEPAPGIKLNRITNLSDDLALGMKALQVRIVAPLPGKSTVGIEIPNLIREDVLLKEILSSPSFNELPSKIRLALGKDIFGNPVSADLAAMPHLLVAGSTGSGKSVGLNGMVLSLLFSATPAEVKMVMIDPKMLEFTLYDGIPHLIIPVIVRPKAASEALRKMVAEMQRRYQLLAEKGVRNIEAYNKSLQNGKSANKPADPEQDGALHVQDGTLHVKQNGQTVPSETAPGGPAVTEHTPLPYIVIFIDELADLMMVAARDVEDSITRLAQMARAAGIHLVLATQRPSVDVLTGVIKANFPARIAYCVSSKTDSRTILDANGAEQLLGKGDMLYLSAGTGKILRIHGAYISEEETKKVVAFIKDQASPSYETPFVQESASPEEFSSDERDDLYEQARELVISTGQASASFIQRRMRVGYPRAARMIEMMEEDGLIGPASGGKPREILIRKEEEPQP